MGLLSDTKILELCQANPPMILPFIDEIIRERNGKKVISYGLDSGGYDIRLAHKFMIPREDTVLDPKHIRDDQYESVEVPEGDTIILKPKSCILGYSLERFNMPRDVKAIAVGKSTYARVGVFPNVTPLESSWRGYLTIEIANLGSSPVVIYPGEGIAALNFFRLKNVRQSYAERGGKYQDQGQSVVLAKV